MRLWVDDVRPAPDGYAWARSVNEAEIAILIHTTYRLTDKIIIDLDHDAGDYARDGGDYIKLLDWLEAKNIVNDTFTFHIHSMNPVGVQNMRAIIQKNGWREI